MGLARFPWRVRKTLLQAAWHYLRGHEVLPYLPIRLWVEPTSYCNLRCVMCPQSFPRAHAKGYMDWDLFRKIIDEAAEFVYDINLHHTGESTLHKRLPDMIAYARQAGIYTRLHSNGTFSGRTSPTPSSTPAWTCCPSPSTASTKRPMSRFGSMPALRRRWPTSSDSWRSRRPGTRKSHTRSWRSFISTRGCRRTLPSGTSSSGSSRAYPSTSSSSKNPITGPAVMTGPVTPSGTSLPPARSPGTPWSFTGTDGSPPVPRTFTVTCRSAMSESRRFGPSGMESPCGGFGGRCVCGTARRSSPAGTVT